MPTAGEIIDEEYRRIINQKYPEYNTSWPIINGYRLLDCWIKKTNGISVDIDFSILNNGIIEN